MKHQKEEKRLKILPENEKKEGNKAGGFSV
jgi:hypothetical protein